MAYSLKCPLCREKFPWDPTQGFPDRCLVCKEEVGHNRADDDICMPSIRSLTTTATDGVYREIERTSEIRAEMAAEQAGVPVSDMAGLKITNLRDGNRPGDVAAMPVVNDVTRQMDAINARGGQMGFGGGPEAALGYSAQVSQGPAPNAGAHALMGLRQNHLRTEGGNAMSTHVPLEMQNPNYRPRV